MTHYIDIEVYLDEHKEDLIDEIDFDDILSELSAGYQSHRVEIGISLCGDLDTYEDHTVDVELDTDDIKSRIEDEIMRLTNSSEGWQRAYAELKQKLVAIENFDSDYDMEKWVSIGTTSDTQMVWENMMEMAKETMNV